MLFAKTRMQVGVFMRCLRTQTHALVRHGVHAVVVPKSMQVDRGRRRTAHACTEGLSRQNSCRMRQHSGSEVIVAPAVSSPGVRPRFLWDLTLSTRREEGCRDQRIAPASSRGLSCRAHLHVCLGSPHHRNSSANISRAPSHAEVAN